MKKLSSDASSTTLVTRAIDAVDRAHAGAAVKIHDVRSQLVVRLEHALDRAEQLSASAIKRARAGLKRADHVSADAVNRAQGVVGHAIENVRVARTTPAFLAS
ncbi:MAG TPA: hypothetical protein VGC42_15250 [Kofleriaceae bacterium]